LLLCFFPNALIGQPVCSVGAAKGQVKTFTSVTNSSIVCFLAKLFPTLQSAGDGDCPRWWRNQTKELIFSLNEVALLRAMEISVVISKQIKSLSTFYN